MVSVQEAKSKIKCEVTCMQPTVLTLENVFNNVIAVDTQSPINMPPFDQSAMYGYGLSDQVANLVGSRHRVVLRGRWTRRPSAETGSGPRRATPRTSETTTMTHPPGQREEREKRCDERKYSARGPRPWEAISFREIAGSITDPRHPTHPFPSRTWTESSTPPSLS